MIEGLQIPFGVQPMNPLPANTWEGPYLSVEDALSSIPPAVRYPTMEVRVVDPVEGNTKYWFKDGINDVDLIPFFSNVGYTGGTISSDIVIVSGHTIYGNGSGLTDLPIGEPEDSTYQDGIFQDFTPQTKVGVVVDRFNEMFKLLAPKPPSDWLVASLLLSNTKYNARKIISGEIVSVITNNTPGFTVSIPTNGLSGVDDGELSFYIDNVVQEIYDFKGHTNKTDGVIRYTYGDPYIGQDGKSGFWVGFLSMSAMSNPIVPSHNLKTAKLNHSLNGNLTCTFYLDNPILPVIDGLHATVPDMSGYVSGVKTMSVGQVITNIGFNIIGASSYFYPVGSVWKIKDGVVYSQEGGLDHVPIEYNHTGVVSGINTSIMNNKFDNDKLIFVVQSKNYITPFGGDVVFSDITKRVDTVSVESERLTSGTGNFPVSFGNAFDSTQSLTDNYTNELQLINGSYKWLAGDYTVFGSPNYSSVTTGDNIGGTHYRWATFNVGNKSTPVNNITITIPDAVIGTSWNAIKMYVKIGDSGWLDATAAQAIGAPYANGDAALNVAASTAYNVRVITFGTVPRSGTVYVRIGIRASDTTFTFKKPTIN